MRHFRQVAGSILRQSMIPTEWVIVDGNSVDGSYEFANALAKQHDWIQVISQKRFRESSYSHTNFAEAVTEGYLYAKALAERDGSLPAYVGKVDATTTLHHDYFEKLMHALDSNQSAVIACGVQRAGTSNRYFRTPYLGGDQIVGFNDVRLYREAFLREMGGYPICPSPDTVLLAKAILRGFEAIRVQSTWFEDARQGGTKPGRWKGYVLHGRAAYFLGYHPLLLAMNAAYLSAANPMHYQMLPVLQGYVESFVARRERIDDPEVFEYFSRRRLRSVMTSILRHGFSARGIKNRRGQIDPDRK